MPFFQSEVSKDIQVKDLWKQTTLVDMFERSSSYEGIFHSYQFIVLISIS